MPLSNNTIIKLNEITSIIEDKDHIKNTDIEEIKKIFFEILKNGDMYDVDEIESWFENEGSWTNKSSRTRIVNLSHYVQDKFEQNTKLRFLPDTNSDHGDSCSCGN